MKKTIALILVLVFCFGLAACGDPSGESPKDNESTLTGNNSSGGLDLCQEWREVSKGITISFDKDGGCVYNGTNCKYEYNESLGVISVYAAYTINLNVTKDGGIYTLTAGRSTFVPTANYEEYHAAYMEEYIAENLPPLIEGKTELLVGNTYTTANGMVFTFEKAELITEGTECGFSLYFLCDTKFEISTAKYNSPRNMAGFGMQEQPNDGEALKYVFGASFDKAKVEEDVNDYGILSFIIDDTEYYVSVDAFFP